ncbi:MAG: tetratricopeptide repeat protein, partial [Planctomycetota bacterium]
MIGKRTPSIPDNAKQPAATLPSREAKSSARADGATATERANGSARARDADRKATDGRLSPQREGGTATAPVAGTRQAKDAGARAAEPSSGSSRTLRKVGAPEQTTVVNRVPSAEAVRVSRYSAVRPATVVYYDQPHLISHSYHYDYAYRDYHGLLCHRIVWPSYCFGVYYNCGPRFSFRYVYPYYHRKYLFVSLGGYWPVSYSYLRYYWYGSHPYNWYGYYPVAREVQGDTYNYYTYNYYNDGEAVQTSSVVDPSVYQNMAQQKAEPAEQTLADTYFEEAVKIFEAGRYSAAVEKFARAMELAPNDMILPFAYGQALMANGQYPEAAEVLRTALAKVSPDKEGVFYPRGLYPDEKTLLAQIDELAKKAELFSS